MKKYIWFIFCWPVLLQAATLYKIELIVFAHLTPEAYQSETWPNPPVLPALSSAQYLSPSQNKIKIYQNLPSSYYGLKRDENALRRANGYQVLTHVAWLQPAGAVRRSRKVRISGQTASGIQWDGFVRVSKSYLFQADTDVVLTVPKAIMSQLSNTLPDLPLYQFVLLQREHPKLKKVYYFDHPLFGMLLQITALRK